jgi:hypothetical protein
LHAAIAGTLQPQMPTQITLVCNQNKNYQTKEWLIPSKSYLPEANQEILLYMKRK